MTDDPTKPKPPALGPIKVQKAADRPAPPLRRKECSACGRKFPVQEGEKFYLCPACYAKTFQKKKRSGEAQILTHITCSACGAEEYLPFVPTDPAEALCKACFLQRRRERHTGSGHPQRS